MRLRLQLRLWHLRQDTRSLRAVYHDNKYLLYVFHNLDHDYSLYHIYDLGDDGTDDNDVPHDNHHVSHDHNK